MNRTTKLTAIVFSITTVLACSVGAHDSLRTVRTECPDRQPTEWLYDEDGNAYLGSTVSVACDVMHWKTIKVRHEHDSTVVKCDSTYWISLNGNWYQINHTPDLASGESITYDTSIRFDTSVNCSTLQVEHEDKGFRSWGTYYALPRGKYLRLNTNCSLITLPREVDSVVCDTFLCEELVLYKNSGPIILRSNCPCDTTWKDPVIRLEEIEE